MELNNVNGIPIPNKEQLRIWYQDEYAANLSDTEFHSLMIKIYGKKGVLEQEAKAKQTIADMMAKENAKRMLTADKAAKLKLKGIEPTKANLNFQQIKMELFRREMVGPIVDEPVSQLLSNLNEIADLKPVTKQEMDKKLAQQEIASDIETIVDNQKEDINKFRTKEENIKYWKEDLHHLKGDSGTSKSGPISFAESSVNHTHERFLEGLPEGSERASISDPELFRFSVLEELGNKHETWDLSESVIRDELITWDEKEMVWKSDIIEQESLDELNKRSMLAKKDIDPIVDRRKAIYGAASNEEKSVTTIVNNSHKFNINSASKLRGSKMELSVEFTGNLEIPEDKELYDNFMARLKNYSDSADSQTTDITNKISKLESSNVAHTVDLSIAESELAKVKGYRDMKLSYLKRSSSTMSFGDITDDMMNIINRQVVEKKNIVNSIQSDISRNEAEIADYGKKVFRNQRLYRRKDIYC